MHDNFQRQVLSLFRKIHTHMATVVNRYCQPMGVTWPQVVLLKELFDHGELTIGELARQLGFTNSNVSAICKRLEKGGFLVRARDVSDQRTVRVSMTHYARQIALAAENDELDLGLFSNASEEDKRVILDGLACLERLINQNMSALPSPEELLPAKWIEQRGAELQPAGRAAEQ